MVSNGLSARRGPLRRPKVCLTHPNPGRCEPPPPPSNIACNVFLDEDPPIEVGEEASIGWDACNTDYDDTLILEPTIEAAIGEIEDVEGAENCIMGHEAFYQAPDDPGLETLTLNVSWPDGSSCQSQCSFLITEEDEEE